MANRLHTATKTAARRLPILTPNCGRRAARRAWLALAPLLRRGQTSPLCQSLAAVRRRRYPMRLFNLFANAANEGTMSRLVMRSTAKNAMNGAPRGTKPATMAATNAVAIETREIARSRNPKVSRIRAPSSGRIGARFNADHPNVKKRRSRNDDDANRLGQATARRSANMPNETPAAGPANAIVLCSRREDRDSV